MQHGAKACCIFAHLQEVFSENGIFAHKTASDRQR